MISPPMKIELVLLTELEHDLKMQLRNIRNEESTREWMINDHIIGEKEHLAWINNLKENKKQIVFSILSDNSHPIGMVSANEIDFFHRNAELGIYLTESTRGLGLGLAVKFAFLNFIFEVLRLEKFNAEVIEGNRSVQLYQKLSYQVEGFKRFNILKNDKRLGLHLFGITRDEWFANREQVFNQYKTILGNYIIDIHWNTEM